MHVDERLRKQRIIRENYNQVVERIYISARNAGRDPDEIRLVAVTKTRPVEVIKYVIDA